LKFALDGRVVSWVSAVAINKKQKSVAFVIGTPELLNRFARIANLFRAKIRLLRSFALGRELNLPIITQAEEINTLIIPILKQDGLQRGGPEQAHKWERRTFKVPA